jgi:hypothetical protein
MTRTCGRPLVVVLLLPLLSTLSLARPARAQGLDVTGSWSVQMQTMISIGGGPLPSTCAFQGTATVSQTGSSFTGALDVTQSSGPGSCPSAMSGIVSGDVTGNQLSMGAVMGGARFGMGTFTGTVTPAAAVGPGSTITGAFSATSGPFAGTGGTWSAVKLAPIAAVPALGAWGLALLALLLFGSALWLLRRTSTPRAR